MLCSRNAEEPRLDPVRVARDPDMTYASQAHQAGISISATVRLSTRERQEELNQERARKFGRYSLNQVAGQALRWEEPWSLSRGMMQCSRGVLDSGTVLNPEGMTTIQDKNDHNN